MSLDSSLRCAAFRMTRERGRCVRNDRMEVRCVRDGREGMLRSGWQEGAQCSE